MRFPQVLLVMFVFFYPIAAHAQHEKGTEDTEDIEVYDTLFLNNKQMLIGELKLITMGKARIDADQIDVVNIELKNIKTIRAVSHSYRIETVQREIFISNIQPDKKRDGFVFVKDSTKTRAIKIEDILSLQKLSTDNKGLWQGAFGLGYSYSRSANIGLLNADAALNYIAPKFELNPFYAILAAQLNNKWYRSNELGGIYGYYNINPTWQYMGILDYQRNLRLGLSRRFQEGFGLAIKVLTTNRIKYKIGSGLVLNQEKSVDNIINNFRLEIPVLNNFELYHFDDPELSIQLIQNFYFSLSQPGRIRHDGQVRLNWELLDDFYIHVAFYDNYDNKPIYKYASKLDNGVLIGLTYTFSQ